eukprot:m.263618 g.263618  ORF g.263618 m.263618 type:complete len:477 (+) comp51305_c0_seq1:230-1660(+)
MYNYQQRNQNPPSRSSSGEQKLKVVEKKLIGKGAYGSAMLCKDSEGNSLVKKNIKCRNFREVRDAKKEAAFLDDLKSTNVIGYKAVDQKNSREVDIYMEYADGGDLAHEIEKKAKNKTHYSEEQLMDRFSDCVKAVDKMHSNGVVHRDIKPGNIFLNKQGQAKMGDFGIATSCSKNGRVQSPIGTPLYLDPQRAAGKEYGQKADMWSLGCVLYEMATLKPAFDVKTMAELKRKVASGKVDMSKIPKEYGPEITKVIKSLLQVKEEKRPSVSDLLKNKMVQEGVRKRSSSLSNLTNLPTSDEGIVVDRMPSAPAALKNVDKYDLAESKPRQPAPPPRMARGRMLQQDGTRIRARSHSPFSKPTTQEAQTNEAPRSRSRALAQQRGSGSRTRSVSPSGHLARGRDIKRPSPLANANTPLTKAEAPNRNLTPEANDVKIAMLGNKGKENIRAVNRALDQLGAHRRAGAGGNWALPPIRT